MLSLAESSLKVCAGRRGGHAGSQEVDRNNGLRRERNSNERHADQTWRLGELNVNDTWQKKNAFLHDDLFSSTRDVIINTGTFPYTIVVLYRTHTRPVV